MSDPIRVAKALLLQAFPNNQRPKDWTPGEELNEDDAREILRDTLIVEKKLEHGYSYCEAYIKIRGHGGETVIRKVSLLNMNLEEANQAVQTIRTLASRIPSSQLSKWFEEGTSFRIQKSFHDSYGIAGGQIGLLRLGAGANDLRWKVVTVAHHKFVAAPGLKEIRAAKRNTAFLYNSQATIRASFPWKDLVAGDNKFNTWKNLLKFGFTILASGMGKGDQVAGALGSSGFYTQKVRLEKATKVFEEVHQIDPAGELQREVYRGWKQEQKLGKESVSDLPENLSTLSKSELEKLYMEKKNQFSAKKQRLHDLSRNFAPSDPLKIKEKDRLAIQAAKGALQAGSMGVQALTMTAIGPNDQTSSLAVQRATIQVARQGEKLRGQLDQLEPLLLIRGIEENQKTEFAPHEEKEIALQTAMAQQVTRLRPQEALRLLQDAERRPRHSDQETRTVQSILREDLSGLALQHKEISKGLHYANIMRRSPEATPETRKFWSARFHLYRRAKEALTAIQNRRLDLLGRLSVLHIHGDDKGKQRIADQLAALSHLQEGVKKAYQMKGDATLETATREFHKDLFFIEENLKLSLKESDIMLRATMPPTDGAIQIQELDPAKVLLGEVAYLDDPLSPELLISLPPPALAPSFIRKAPPHELYIFAALIDKQIAAKEQNVSRTKIGAQTVEETARQEIELALLSQQKELIQERIQLETLRENPTLWNHPATKQKLTLLEGRLELLGVIRSRSLERNAPTKHLQLAPALLELEELVGQVMTKQTRLEGKIKKDLQKEKHRFFQAHLQVVHRQLEGLHRFTKEAISFAQKEELPSDEDIASFYQAVHNLKAQIQSSS